MNDLQIISNELLEKFKTERTHSNYQSLFKEFCKACHEDLQTKHGGILSWGIFQFHISMQIAFNTKAINML
jgi:hypothetical protein